MYKEGDKVVCIAQFHKESLIASGADIPVLEENYTADYETNHIDSFPCLMLKELNPGTAYLGYDKLAFRKVEEKSIEQELTTQKTKIKEQELILI